MELKVLVAFTWGRWTLTAGEDSVGATTPVVVLAKSLEKVLLHVGAEMGSVLWFSTEGAPSTVRI